jgi:hypothetical protein
MNDPNGLSGQILEAAGAELYTEISKMEPCRTGESRITGGYKLPCQYARSFRCCFCDLSCLLSSLFCFDIFIFFLSYFLVVF